ncbi:DnaB-like helicase C-terminal domain-containing protein [Loigolactobacillus zhaoyuanensis]|uniref:DnaB-like helicase C-terminal domain-containing protein n=1 Tax=Loigolactobacillus zhaoyuanensis TaxID=2486017 RepID=UPI000F7494AF|nr:DnaB-like helicase C-terminal domain-containing protein [Loigolactobacillus zhaoyuanensis]
MNIETEICHYLIQHPTVLKTTTLAAQWFKQQKCRTLIRWLLDDQGSYRHWTEIQQRFSAAEPQVFTETDWQSFAQPTTDEAAFQGSVRMLEFNSVQAKLADMAQAYLAKPSMLNCGLLTQYSQQLAALNQPRLATRSLPEHGAAMLQALAQTQPTGVQTFNGIDTVLGGGLRGDVLWTIGARPGIGKSAFAINLIQQAISHAPDLQVDLFSLEMSATENYQRTLAYTTGVAAGKFNNPAHQMTAAEKQQVRMAIDQVNPQQLQLHDSLLVLTQIIKVIRAHAQKAGAGNYLAVIDYLQIISLTRLAARNDRRQEIETITRELKLLTNELHIPIILFSQLNRELEKRPDQTPQLADLRESGSIEQDSNVVSFLYPASTTEAQRDVRRINLIFRKNRSGRLSELQFNFEPEKMRFTPQVTLQQDVAVGEGSLKMQQDVVAPW